MITKFEIFMAFIIGLTVGVAWCAISVTGDNSNWADKSKLQAKQTIVMDNCYAQYSAVRRFPR